MNKKYVVITGCLGFLGKHFTRLCLQKGWRVYGIDSCEYCADMAALKNFNDNDNFTFIKEDIRNLKFLPRCDYVVNTAAQSHVANSISNSQPFVDTNVGGVQNLLELCRRFEDNRQPLFFHVSTDEVYGDIIDGEFTEESLPNASNPYSATKTGGDQLVIAYARTYGTKYNIIRPTNFYGVGQYPEKLIPLAVENLNRGLKIPLHQNGNPIRRWLHVEDACEAIFVILKSGKRNEIYNCSGKFEQSNLYTIKQILSAYFEVPLSQTDDLINDHCDMSYNRKGQDVRYAVKDEKLRALGWRTTRNLGLEIKDIVKFHKENDLW